MWYVNIKTEVQHECSKEYFDEFYSKNEDYQVIPDVEKAPEKKTKKALIAEAKELGVKGADRMSAEELSKAVE